MEEGALDAWSSLESSISHCPLQLRAGVVPSRGPCLPCLTYIWGAKPENLVDKGISGASPSVPPPSFPEGAGNFSFSEGPR